MKKFALLLVCFAVFSLVMGVNRGSARSIAPYSGMGPTTTGYQPPSVYFPYQQQYAVTDKVGVVWNIVDSTGKNWNGISQASFAIDDTPVGSLTSGQPGTATVNGGTCVQQGYYYNGYYLNSGTNCQTGRMHKVELTSVQGGSGVSSDPKCPSAVCFYDPKSNDVRYYLTSDKIQAKGDGQTAEFDFKIQYRIKFATMDQKGSPIDLTGSWTSGLSNGTSRGTSNGVGWMKSDGTGPFAYGDDLQNDGTVSNLAAWNPSSVETVSRNTRYLFDHYMVFTGGGDVGNNMGKAAQITADAPKTIWAVWQKQYYLIVNGNCLPSSGAPFACGNPQGTGWYNEGAQATYAVDSRARDPGWEGPFGGFYQLNRWTGDSASQNPQGTINMNAVKQVTARFNYNDQGALQGIATLVALGLLPVGVLIWVLNNRRRSRPAPMPPIIPGGPMDPGGLGGVLMGPGGMMGLGSGQTGFQAGPVPTNPPAPPGLGGNSSASGLGSGGGSQGSVTSGSGLGQTGSQSSGASGPSLGQMGSGTGSTDAVGSSDSASGAIPDPGGGMSAGDGGGSGSARVMAASGLAAGGGLASIGAVALLNRRDKCVWCESKIKRDQSICSRCGVHQTCTTCGTALYKTYINSKGFKANPQDQGLFCDRCNKFTS